MADVPDEVRNDRRYAKFAEYSIQGTVDAVGKEFGGFDILIHSIAFSREITKSLIDTSRKAYHEAMGVIGVFAGEPDAGRGAVHGEPSRRGQRRRADLRRPASKWCRITAAACAPARRPCRWTRSNWPGSSGDKNIRVNLISAGPYASRAARAIGKDFDKLIEHAAEHSPLPPADRPGGSGQRGRRILCSPLASAVTGQVLYVDCGYNIMGT